MQKLIPFILAALVVLGVIGLLGGCQFIDQVLPPPTTPLFRPRTSVPAVQNTPAVLTATAAATYPPTRTPFPTATPIPTATPTATPTLTHTPEPQIEAEIVTCDTGIDIAHGLGEVTNGYVLVKNVGARGVTGMVVSLEANDEDQARTDRSYNVGYLPSGYQMALKLTVDTKNGVDTILTAHVTAVEGVDFSVTANDCSRRSPDRAAINALGTLFELQKIGE